MDVVDHVVSFCDPILVRRNTVVKTQFDCENYYELVAYGGGFLRTD
jgi:hypothetical protein